MSVWGVRFEIHPLLKALGDAFPAHHLHQFRHSLLAYTGVAEIGLSLAGRRMLLAVREIQSNIWLAERDSAPAQPAQ